MHFVIVVCFENNWEGCICLACNPKADFLLPGLRGERQVSQWAPNIRGPARLLFLLSWPGTRRSPVTHCPRNTPTPAPKLLLIPLPQLVHHGTGLQSPCSRRPKGPRLPARWPSQVTIGHSVAVQWSFVSDKIGIMGTSLEPAARPRELRFWAAVQGRGRQRQSPGHPAAQRWEPPDE